MLNVKTINAFYGVIDLKFIKMGDTAPAGPKILRKGASHELWQYGVRLGYELFTNASISTVR